MTENQLLETANNILRNKITGLVKSKRNPATLSFGSACSNGVTILFGTVNTYVLYNSVLYKGTNN